MPAGQYSQTTLFLRSMGCCGRGSANHNREAWNEENFQRDGDRRDRSISRTLQQRNLQAHSPHLSHNINFIVESQCNKHHAHAHIYTHTWLQRALHWLSFISWRFTPGPLDPHDVICTKNTDMPLKTNSFTWTNTKSGGAIIPILLMQLCAFCGLVLALAN